MSSKKPIGQVVSVDEQGLEQPDAAADEQALRPSMAQLTQAKVDANAPGARPHGMTLAAEERMRAREAEIARTRERAESNPTTTRERGSRACAAARAAQTRAAFQERRASVTRWAGLDAPDPRATLGREDLAAVNQQAARIAETVERSAHRASIARRLAQRVADGQSILDASLTVKDDELTEPGRVINIADIGTVDSPSVTVQGRIDQLWTPSHRAIQDVGLIADESGRVKFTIWKKSCAKTVSEGEHVRLTNVSKSWHQGRVSVAVTGWSLVTRLGE